MFYFKKKYFDGSINIGNDGAYPFANSWTHVNHHLFRFRVHHWDDAKDRGLIYFINGNGMSIGNEKEKITVATLTIQYSTT